MKKIRLNFTLHGPTKDGVVVDVSTRSYRAFYHSILRDINPSVDSTARLRVSYGAERGANWGDYATKKDLVFALKAFTEDYNMKLRGGE